MILIRKLLNGNVISEQAFREGPIILGRSPEASVVLEDDSVSEKHAVLAQNNEDVWILRDNDSDNGIRIDQDPVGELEIKEKIRVFIGQQEIELLPVSSSDTRKVDVSDWQFLDRRRGSQSYLRSGMGVFFFIFFYDLLNFDLWDESFGEVLQGMFVDLVIGFLVWGILGALLLIVYRHLERKVRAPDTYRAAVEPFALLIVLRVSQVLSFYVFAPHSRFMALVLILALPTWWILFRLFNLRAEDTSQRLVKLRHAVIGALFLIAFILHQTLIPREGTAVLPRQYFPKANVFFWTTVPDDKVLDYFSPTLKEVDQDVEKERKEQEYE